MQITLNSFFLFFIVFISDSIFLTGNPESSNKSGASFRQPDNKVPVIKIERPANHSTILWNETVPFSIDVSDAEDGELKYQEINPAEVLVRLKFAESTVAAERYLKDKKITDTMGLYSMVISNCFNCHGVKVKKAGPSFCEIATRYSNNAGTQTQLFHHIKEGSTGIWGKESMPTHPELSDKMIQNMVAWIMIYSKDPSLNFLIGTQGILPLPKPAGSFRTGKYIITAYYTDHGVNNRQDLRKTGVSQITLSMK